MAKIDLAKQEKKIAQLKSELEALNLQLEKMKEKCGFAKDDDISQYALEMTPELKEALAKAKERAKLVAQRDVARMKEEIEGEPAFSTTQRRRGMIPV